MEERPAPTAVAVAAKLFGAILERTGQRLS